MKWSERITVVRSELERLDTLCEGIVTRQGSQHPCLKDATTFEREVET